MSLNAVVISVVIRGAVIICALAIVFGPLYTDPGYEWMRHSISELAGQGTSNAWIMRAGLLALGLAALLGFFAVRSNFNVFLLVFGISIALTGVFPHRHFDSSRAYSVLLDQIHSGFASAGGFFAVLGFTYRTFQVNTVSEKIVSASLAGLYTLLSAAMFYWPDYQGAFQRVIFGTFIIWVLTHASTTDDGAGISQ